MMRMSMSLPAPSLTTVADAHAAIECLGRLAELYAERREQLARSVGLTEQQWDVLERIATEHFMPSLFARRRESSAAAVSRLIRQLLDKRLVTASARDHDGRQRQYVLTAKGRRTLDALRAGRQAAIDVIWSSLDRGALTTFTEVSAELIR